MGLLFSNEVLDAALIAAAQRVEHYEIAAYGTVYAFADLLDEDEQSSLLQETLEEEKQTDQKLTELSEEVNMQAEAAASEESEATTSEDEEEQEGQERRRPSKWAS